MDLVSIHFAEKWYRKHGGSTVDDGYHIEWDGNTDNRDFIDLSAIAGMKLYKVSNLVVGAEKLQNSTAVILINLNITENITFGQSDIVDESAWAAAFLNDAPAVVSGTAGTYHFNGLDVTIPADGTYFYWAMGDFEGHVSKLYKPAQT